ncbi:hypothetical protein DAEQUDRAFT_766447 [Daedalea quercina L-15889]|uniref:RNI-like protein n=1 Tax=Daedalea quercina L-15889 TaxID=1314783 RepID=A0A165PIU4_9APHY|nr:hypothetical protein DAEQUDRAFT_766447 [Daedalea quercina L-15889]
MSASRALHCLDILQEVLTCLRECGEWGTLASCAAVNKTFCDPALDDLWKKTSDLTPLFAILTSFHATEITEGFDTSIRYWLSGDILPEDLHRLQFYARKIIELEVDDSNEELESSTLLSLSRALGGQPLLPRLQRLIWIQMDPADNNILYLVNPSLRYLGFSCEDTSATIASTTVGPCVSPFDSLLHEVATATPYLREFCLELDDASCSLAPIVAWRNLRHIDLAAPSVGLGQCAQLTALSRLDGLTHLSLCGLGQLGTDDVQAFRQFRTLEELFCEGETTSITRVLEQFGKSASTIRKLRVKVSAGSDIDVLGLTDVIKTHFDASLRELSFQVCCGKLQPTNSGVSFLDLIRPLLDMRDLRVVSLQTDGSSSTWCNEVLCAMASAWPAVVSLEVLWAVSDDRGPTLQCLPHVARCCPHLRRLCLTSVGCTWDASLNVVSPASHGLQTLSTIRDLRIPTNPDKSVADIALFLDRLFPSLDTSEIPSSAPPLSTRWREVVGLVRELRRARMQEGHCM